MSRTWYCFSIWTSILAVCTDLAGQSPPVFRAGFAAVDITPPPGTPKQGGNAEQAASSVLDPLYARAAAFELGAERIAIVVVDTALIQAVDVAAIRRKTTLDHGLPTDRLLVAATHNHAGPAVDDPAFFRDHAYVESMVVKAAGAVGLALAALEPAEIGVGSAFEWNVAYNRRVRMRDGTTRTHGSLQDPNALGFEGPIDPEVGVMAARGRDGKVLGAIVNFACHAGHHWDDGVISAGFPGAMVRQLKDRGVPFALFLQGAAGNMHHQDPRGAPEKSAEEIGKLLAGAAARALESAKWFRPKRIAAASRTLSLAYRQVSSEEARGAVKGAQRFEEKGYYDRKIPGLIARSKAGPALGEVQVLRIDEVAIASQPSESFAELGLRIKEETWPVRTFVAGYANGMLGYIPTREAFRRGGYESTFGPPSFMAPETGDQLAEAAVALVKELSR